jgi:hypothetical protein
MIDQSAPLRGSHSIAGQSHQQPPGAVRGAEYFVATVDTLPLPDGDVTSAIPGRRVDPDAAGRHPSARRIWCRWTTRALRSWRCAPEIRHPRRGDSGLGERSGGGPASGCSADRGGRGLQRIVHRDAGITGHLPRPHQPLRGHRPERDGSDPVAASSNIRGGPTINAPGCVAPRGQRDLFRFHYEGPGGCAARNLASRSANPGKPPVTPALLVSCNPSQGRTSNRVLW